MKPDQSAALMEPFPPRPGRPLVVCETCSAERSCARCRQREYDRRYKAKKRLVNRAAYNAYQRAYRQTHPQTDPAKRLATGERHRRRNLALFADKERLRRARKRSNGGKVSRREWRRLLQRHAGRCFYCGASATTLDHLIPVARGGTSFIGNLVPACVSCNSRKQDRLPVEFRYRRAAA